MAFRPPATDRALFWALLILLAVAALAWRFDAQRHHYWMADEDIPLAVVQQVRSSGTLDTNWARTRIEEKFRYDQFNFSSYHLLAAALSLNTEVDLDAAPHQLTGLRETLRRWNAVFGALCVLFAGLLGRRLAGNAAGLIGAALTAANVTQFQDALYARPETFTTALTLGLALIVTGGQVVRPAAIAGAGLLSGLLVACKVSALLLVPFVLAALLSAARERTAHLILLGFCAACGLGFVLGAPFALKAPHEYLHGVGYLFSQYGGMHWPHGVHDGAVVDRLAHALGYLRHTLGLSVLLAVLGGAVWAARFASLRWQIVLLGLALSGLYFMQSRVFFERNLSHVLPFAFLLAGAAATWAAQALRQPLARHALLAAAALLLVLPAVLPSWTLSQRVLPQHHAREAKAFEASLRERGLVVVDVGTELPHAEHLLEQTCGDLVFRMLDYGDRYTQARLARLDGHPTLELLAHFPNPFAPIPASTLQTYHGAGLAFLHPTAAKRDGCAVAVTRMPGALQQKAPTAVRLEGHAARNAHHHGAVPPQGAEHLYATWNGSDQHTGAAQLNTELCRGDLVPVVVGPQAAHPALKIDVDRGSGFEPLYSGPVPVPADGWVALRIDHGSDVCLPARLGITDASDAWGAWVGIGAPARPSL